MRRSARILSGYQLTRLLAHGGMLAPKRGTWHVYRGPDTRFEFFGLVPSHVVARLEAAGHLHPLADHPDRRVASSALPWPVVAGPVRPPEGVVTSRGKRPEPAMETLLASLSSRAARIRLKAAAGRFLDDFRRSVHPPPAHLKMRHTDDAASRMAALQRDLGAAAMGRLEDLIADRTGLRALSRRWGQGEENVLRETDKVLRALAAVYDLSPEADSPALASARTRSSIAASPLER